MQHERRRRDAGIALTIGLLALPALGVHAWMAATFPSYAHGALMQDVPFTFCWCALLVLIARWRLIAFLSWPLAWLAYLVWLFLVLGEGVSYSLQADTFNARFFAHLNPVNLVTGLRAFPWMIGGGIVVLAVMAVLSAFLLWRAGSSNRSTPRWGALRKAGILAALALLVLGLDSAPRRLGMYFVQVAQSAHFADTPQGRAVAKLLNLYPTKRSHVIAAPGKDLVIIYMESLERQFWDPRAYPGLTPNLDRLRSEGLEFSGFETFSGAGYTMAGLFASQCGVPFFSSAFAGIDEAAGNDTDLATFQPKLACLGDVLHQAGYRQVFLGGAPITFSNKGEFFSTHGYNEALGLTELEEKANGKLPQSGWGLYDSTLFDIALQRYRKLEARGKPFNLTLLTLDTHPPHGRPSPGCPPYVGNSNTMLQAVHCTDYLIGRFIDALSKEPDWNRTVVVIMSDHLAMRNDAEPFYPEHYHRQPALLVLNAGRGVRSARMYHMDIAPTVLHLLGVRSNASFIAGADRSAPNAPGSALVDDRVTESVLRKASWSHTNRFELCHGGELLGWASDGEFDLGGRELPMSYLGEPAAGIRTGQSLDFFVDRENAKLLIADAGQQRPLLAARGKASVLMIRLLPVTQRGSGTFTVDWLGKAGAIAHIADIPRLRGLTIRSSDCAALLRQADGAQTGQDLDFSGRFEASVAPYASMPAAPKRAKFTKPEALEFERGLGWLWPQTWGSWAWGDEAALGLRVTTPQCKAILRMNADPYLPSSRPALDTQVWVNGELATTWHFRRDDSPKVPQGSGDVHTILPLSVPLTGDEHCDAQVELRFVRPGPRPAVIPADEDARDLQLRVLDASVDETDSADR